MIAEVLERGFMPLFFCHDREGDENVLLGLKTGWGFSFPPILIFTVVHFTYFIESQY